MSLSIPILGVHIDMYERRILNDHLKDFAFGLPQGNLNKNIKQILQSTITLTA